MNQTNNRRIEKMSNEKMIIIAQAHGARCRIMKKQRKTLNVNILIERLNDELRDMREREEREEQEKKKIKNKDTDTDTEAKSEPAELSQKTENNIHIHIEY